MTPAKALILATMICAIPGLSASASMTGAQTEALSPSQSNKAVISAAFDRWSSGDGDFFSAVLSPQVIWTIEGSGASAGVYRGRDDFVRRAVAPFASKMQSPVRPATKRIWAEGDHVIVNWSGEGVAGDGRPYQNDYVWILRLEDGKAVEVTAFLDLPAYDAVLGRVPAPAGPR